MREYESDPEPSVDDDIEVEVEDEDEDGVGGREVEVEVKVKVEMKEEYDDVVTLEDAKLKLSGTSDINIEHQEPCSIKNEKESYEKDDKENRAPKGQQVPTTTTTTTSTSSVVSGTGKIKVSPMNLFNIPVSSTVLPLDTPTISQEETENCVNGPMSDSAAGDYDKDADVVVSTASTGLDGDSDGVALGIEGNGGEEAGIDLDNAMEREEEVEKEMKEQMEKEMEKVMEKELEGGPIPLEALRELEQWYLKWAGVIEES